MLNLRVAAIFVISFFLTNHSLATLAEIRVATSPAPVELPELNQIELNALLGGKRGAYMLVSSGALDKDQGRVYAVALDGQQRPRSRTPMDLSCARLSMAQSANKPDTAKIFCLSNKKTGLINDAFAAPTGFIFSNRLDKLLSFEQQQGLTGPSIISRARISVDGLYIASTVFKSGAGYKDMGGMFSTETRVGKTDGSMPPENIEKWKVMAQNGTIITSPDLNLWGVTFDPTNTNRFFVTVSLKGKPRLAKGNISLKEIRIINNTAAIECPSFSPDGTKIAFKRISSKNLQWSPAVLNLVTGVETVFDVGFNIDDQIEWLNDNTLIYEFRTSNEAGLAVMSLMKLDTRSASNKGQLFLNTARSPSFFRP